MAIYKTTEWESGAGGTWYVEDNSFFTPGVDKWVIPARILNMEITDFLKLLIDKYNAKIFYKDDCSFVGWSFSSLKDARNYKNWINREARERKFFV